jgi:hypothetical protein
MSKRVLVVCHSLSGQLRECAEALIAPMREGGDVEVRLADPTPERPYRFPMTMRSFLDLFPDSVLQQAPAMQPLPIEPGERFDLVILCYQVWYLSPALPVLGFLESQQAKVLRDTPVVVLGATRNMWQRGWLELKKLIEKRGGRIIDHLMLVDRGPGWSTFYTTPRWLLTGKKSGRLFTSGVSPEAIASLSEPGRILAEAVRAGRLDGSVFAREEKPVLEVCRKNLIPEIAGKGAFRIWARTIKAVSRRAPGLRYPLELTWFGWLLTMLPLIPGCRLVGALSRVFFPAWYQKQMETLALPSHGRVV